MKRILSLDVFRGLTVAFMILVNNQGNGSFVYSPLKHSLWNGCSIADMIFPFFLFIVGISSFYSLKKYNYTLNKECFSKIIKRGFLLFGIGVLLNYFPFYDQSLSDLRIMGVLQRIAIAYVLGSIVCCALKTNKKLLIVSTLILLAYWIILYFFGGENPYSKESNIVRSIDLSIFGENHIYHGRFFGLPFDPEGLLSTCAAISSVIYGFIVGQYIGNEINIKKIARMILASFIFIGLALIWNMYLPINKALWTSSYVFYTIGFGILCFSLLISLIEILNHKKWTYPFVVFGSNAISIYVLSDIFAVIFSKIYVSENNSLKKYFYNEALVPLFGNYAASLLYGVLFIGLLWIISYILYKKKIFIKL